MSDFLRDRNVPQNYLRVAAPAQDMPESDVGFGEALDAAITFTSPSLALTGLADEARIKTDPTYRLDFDSAKQGVPEYAWPQLAKALEDSRSLEHTNHIRDKLMGELSAAENLQAYTGGNLAGNLGMTLMASALDPINLAVGVGTAGAGLAATAGMHGARLSRVKRAMTIAGMEGAANAAIELPLYYANKTATEDDILWAAAFGATLGGAIGGLAPPKPGTLAKRAYDAERANAEQTMDRMADVEAATVNGLEPAPQPIPEDFMRALYKDPLVRKSVPEEPRGIDWTVRSKEQQKAEEAYKLAISKQEARIKELDETVLPDEPVPFKMRDELDGFKEELSFFKTLGDQGLSAKDLTRAKVEYGRAKSQFMEAYRDADPEGFQQIFGNRDRLNPPNEELEAAIPTLMKRIEKLEAKSKKEGESYAAALDALGTQKDEALDAIDALKAEMKAMQDSYKQKAKAKSVGAAEAERGGIELSKLTEEELDDLFDPDTPVARQFRVGRKEDPETGEVIRAGIPLRYDLAGQADRSPNPGVADAGRKLFQDAIPKEGHAPNPESATELAEMWRDTVMTIYQTESNAAFTDWAKVNGFHSGAAGWFRDPRGYARGQFEEMVTEAVEAGTHADPHVAKVAKTFSDMTARVYEIGEEYLPGFDQFPSERTWVPRAWNNEKLQHLNSDFKIDPASLDEGVDSLLAQVIYNAIRDGFEDYDPALTAKVSNGMAKRFIERSTDVNFEYPDFSRLTAEHLEELFDDLAIPRTEREKFYEKMGSELGKDEDTGRVGHAKRRVPMEINHTPVKAIYTGDSRYAGMKTGDTVEITIKDLHTRRADALLHGYVNQVAGYGALSKVTNGKVHNDMTVKKWMSEIKEYEQTYGDDLQRVDKEIRKLMIGVNHTLGRALEDPNSQAAVARRYLNGWNFMRVMNQAVAPQYSESSKIITATSLESVSHYLPRVGNAFRLMRAGEELPDDVKLLVLAAREHGIGGSFARGGSTVTRYQSDIDGTMFNKYGRRQWLEWGKRPTAAMLQFALDQQEILTYMAMTSEWGQRAKGIKQFTKSDYNRFAWMGIDRDMVKRINKQMLKHAKGEDGKPWAESDSKFIADLNFREWDDYVARDKYGFGMKRRIGETIQTNNPGNLPEWSQRNIGAMISQFRSFPIAAHHKQLLHGIGMNDMQAYMTFMANSLFAALARAGQVAINSIGREDADAYRERYMSPEMLAYAAFERSAWSGVSSMTTIPAHVYKMMTGEYPGSMRSTGLDRGLGGVPAVDVINRVMATPGALKDMVSDGDVQGFFRQLWGFMPYSNMPGLNNAAQAMLSTLPE